jgi:hypothetical protein
MHLQHEDAPLGGFPLLGVHICRPNKIVYSAVFREAAADEADRLQVTCTRSLEDAVDTAAVTVEAGVNPTCSMKNIASYGDPSDLHLLGRVQRKAIDSLERLVVHQLHLQRLTDAVLQSDDSNLGDVACMQR